MNPQSSQSNRLVILLVAGLALLFVFLLPRLALASGAFAVPPPRTTDQAQIDAIKGALTSSSIDSTARAGLVEKLTMVVRIATQKATITPRYTPPQAGAQALETAVPFPAVTLEPAFFEGSEGIIRPSMALVQNGWEGYLDGRPAQLFAGVHPENATQGMVIVVLLSTPDFPREMQTYADAMQRGWLRLVSEENGVFELTAEDGSVVYFDARQRVFLDSRP
jgi:hypothetical protein